MKRVVARTCFGAGILCLGVAGLMTLLRVHVNLSPSLPLGLYRETSTAVVRGAIVVSCLPAGVIRMARTRRYVGRGTCPGDLTPIGKVVAALPGDTVVFDTSGMIVNGRQLPYSAPQHHDRAGRPLTPYPPSVVVLPPESVLLYAPHAGSFDARYFGPLNHSSVRAVVYPIWTVD